MRLLLTNDDGLGAPGLEALERVLGEHHDVWVAAPESEMSGQSHSITLNEGLKLTRHGSNRFAVRGTPVDCVNLALQAILPAKPDLVISGINKGPNLGTDIIYSGTCAAAREASFRGLPAVAVSLASLRGPWHFGPPAAFIEANLDKLLGHWREDRFINVNWPETAGIPLEVQFTKPGRRRYKDEMVCFTSPRGGEYWFLQPAAVESSEEERTDTLSVHQGAVSITPVALEPSLAPSDTIRDTMEWRGL